MIELLAEPLYVMTLRYLLFGPRAAIEVSASFIRCLSSVYLVCYHPELEALAFSYSWLLNALTVTGGFYLYFFYLVRKTKQIAGQRKRDNDKKREKEKDQDTQDAREQDRGGESRLEFGITSMVELLPWRNSSDTR